MNDEPGALPNVGPAPASRLVVASAAAAAGAVRAAVLGRNEAPRF
jgi:hypothetical protein